MRVAGNHIIIYKDQIDITRNIFLLLVVFILAVICLVWPVVFYIEMFSDLSDILPSTLLFIVSGLCLVATEWVLRADEKSKMYNDRNLIAWLPFGSFLLCIFLSIQTLKANAPQMETAEAWISISSISVGLLLLLYILRRVFRISYDKKQLPILTLCPEGLIFLNDPLCEWKNINHIDLWIVFDQKTMQLHLHSNEVIEYPLISQYSVSEFKNLSLLKSYLEKFTEKVVIRHDSHPTE